MTMEPRLRLWLVQALCVLAALTSLAGWPRAGAAQALTTVGSPTVLPVIGSGLAISTVDGSFEFVEAQRVQTDSNLVAFNVVVTHVSTGGQVGPTTFASPLTGPGYYQFNPAAVALQQGGFAVVWANAIPYCDLSPDGSLPCGSAPANAISARLLDGTGKPVGPEIQVSPDSNPNALVPVALLAAPLSSGGFVVSWVQQSSTTAALMTATFSATGQLLTGPSAARTVGSNIGLVGLADGGFIASWGGASADGVYWQRFNAAATAVAPPVQAANVDNGGLVVLAANPAGQVALAWMTTDPFAQPLSSIMFLEYSADGTALAPPAQVAIWNNNGGLTRTPYLYDVAVNRQGQTLVVWSMVTQGVPYISTTLVQQIDAAGAFSGAPLPIDSKYGKVLAEDDGSWSLLGADATNTYVQKFSGPSCSPSALSLCLDDNRFRLDVQFANPLTGGTGTGNPEPLSADTGALWFFDASLPELVAKVLDGTSVNGHFWVFFASLTDVEFDLTVTDTKTGGQRVYHNPAGTLASQADTSFPLTAAAKPAVPAASRLSTPGRAAPAARSEPVEPVEPVETWGPAETAEPVAPVTPAAPARPAVRAAAAAPVCNSTADALCLLNSEFAVTVAFEETAGSPSTAGQAVQLSADGGYYWFFGPDDTELVVKIIDGRTVNGHIWLFYASLTNVEFDLTVTDSFSATHASRTYHNPAGTLASAADTSAF
jgi:hypothetical protein